MSVYEDTLRRQSLRGTWQGVIAEDVNDVKKPVWVIVPDMDPLFRHGPCRWQPRFQDHKIDVAEGDEGSHKIIEAKFVYPEKGDLCLLQFDNRLELWVPIYWPHRYPWQP